MKLRACRLGRDTLVSYQPHLDALESRIYPGDALGLLGWMVFGASVDLLRPDPWVSPLALIDTSAQTSDGSSGASTAVFAGLGAPFPADGWDTGNGEGSSSWTQFVSPTAADKR